jgi:hypothetical protein
VCTESRRRRKVGVEVEREGRKEGRKEGKRRRTCWIITVNSKRQKYKLFSLY